jgi:omega-6 fatty acid desaturase (delta-12 desaturase)
VFLNNIFVHVPHHVDVRIPCHKLPAAAAAIKDAFPDAVQYDRVKLGDYFATTKTCKLYDFEAQRWLRYP